MAIQIFNSISGQKEIFKPLSPGRVRMYCCGVTPYSNTHIGHSRTFFSYDLLYRTLCDADFSVDWARNITDVDDKIIKKANDEGKSCAEIVDRYVSEQDAMLEKFNLVRPAHEPKVTAHIQPIIELIETLLEKEMAYVSSSGVYYRVRKFPEYGKLSKNRVDDLRKGVRIEVDESKEDSLDFALWKFAKPGEVKWASPWGDGRPGWHVECSAMVHALFGESIDIHMGGRDLIFPHHEAEIAQSEGATGKEFSRYWMHCGMVTLYGEKMSKSTNHFVSVTDFLDKYPQEVLRLLFLSVNYSQPLDFTFELADQNLKKLAKLYRFVGLVDEYADSERAASVAHLASSDTEIFAALETLVDEMRQSLRDDLNSAAALGTFFEFVRSANQGLAALEKKSQTLSPRDASRLKNHWPLVKKWLGQVLGLLGQPTQRFFDELKAHKVGSEFSTRQIQNLIDERLVARQSKDWQRADKIRDELAQQGIQIQDTPQGTKWTVLL